MTQTALLSFGPRRIVRRNDEGVYIIVRLKLFWHGTLMRSLTGVMSFLCHLGVAITPVMFTLVVFVITA